MRRAPSSRRLLPDTADRARGRMRRAAFPHLPLPPLSTSWASMPPASSRRIGSGGARRHGTVGRYTSAPGKTSAARPERPAGKPCGRDARREGCRARPGPGCRAVLPSDPEITGRHRQGPSRRSILEPAGGPPRPTSTCGAAADPRRRAVFGALVRLRSRQPPIQALYTGRSGGRATGSRRHATRLHAEPGRFRGRHWHERNC